MFINFPASCYMTNFEIVEIQNDMIRTRRLEEDQLAEQTRRTEEQEEDPELDNPNLLRLTPKAITENYEMLKEKGVD